MRTALQSAASPLGGPTLTRAASVTLALGLLGAVADSVVGTGLLVVTLLALSGPSIFPLIGDFLATFAAMGAAFGAVTLPLAAWALPTVAVWRIVAATSVAAAIGGIIGFATSDGLVGLLLGASIGFVYAASLLAMRVKTRRR